MEKRMNQMTLTTESLKAITNIEAAKLIYTMVPRIVLL